MTKEKWLPLTQFAIREGVSVSTLRRKIKSNKVTFRLEEGRYLILSNDNDMGKKTERDIFPVQSQDRTTPTVKKKTHKIDLLENEKVQLTSAEWDLKWKALEVRVNGLVKKVEYLTEQNSELNMLVRIFEEKLDVSL